MSYYRDVYLKSPEWQNIQLEALILQKYQCRLCGAKDIPLDVHHLQYRHLWDVKRKDLKILCRDCHEKVHRLMAKYKLLKKLSPERQWFIVKSHLSPQREQVLDTIATKAKFFPTVDLVKARLGIDRKPVQA